jgi:Xaa-Pro aminopeptidase
VLDHPNKAGVSVPFDAARLDALMDDKGIDVILATSPHNVQYLLGGYRFFFFETITAIGVSRYLPIIGYFKGRPDATLYVGSGMEKYASDTGAIWSPHRAPGSWGSTDAMATAIGHIKKLGLPVRRIGIEAAFLPADAKDALTSALPGAGVVDALRILELLRAMKTPEELALLKKVAEGVEGGVLAAFASARPGMNGHQFVERVREGQFARGVDFAFCQVSIGSSLNRVPSDEILKEGAIVSLDAGGTLKGYAGDLCRMGVAGEPDAELIDLLSEVDVVQQAARRAIRAGVAGGSLIAAGDAAVQASPHRSDMDFTVHGMGLVLHEAPRLAYGRPLPYPADDAEGPLEVGMLLSVETAIRHPARGYIKLEDTLAVTADGADAFADNGRGWNRIGSAD